MFGIVWALGGLVILLKDGPHTIPTFDYRTPGKYYLHVRVTDENKHPITFIMSAKRNIVVAANLFCLSISFFVSFIPFMFIKLVLLTVVGILNLGCFLWLVYETWKLFNSTDNRRPSDIKVGTIVEYY